MSPARRAVRYSLPLLVAIVVTAALLTMAFYMGRANADPSPALAVADATPDVEGGLAHWWQTGALAAPVAGLAFVLLIGLERLSLTRWPGLGWLRRGSVRAYLSLSIGAVSCLLPAVADGSVTWGGFATALLGGFVAFRSGGGERKGEQSGEIVATEGP